MLDSYDADGLAMILKDPRRFVLIPASGPESRVEIADFIIAFIVVNGLRSPTTMFVPLDMWQRWMRLGSNVWGSEIDPEKPPEKLFGLALIVLDKGAHFRLE